MKQKTKKDIYRDKNHYYHVGSESVKYNDINISIFNNGDKIVMDSSIIHVSNTLSSVLEYPFAQSKVRDRETHKIIPLNILPQYIVNFLHNNDWIILNHFPKPTKFSKMRYRDHRGTLKESMKTVIEVSSINDIICHLNKDYKRFNKKIKEIKFERVGLDERIKWDTYYVLQRFKGENNFTIAGMSDGCF